MKAFTQHRIEGIQPTEAHQDQCTGSTIFFIFSSSAGGRVIKSRYLEAKPLKFSPPKSLCGIVGSPWVSLATLFGFWETLIKFSESMILYGEKAKFALLWIKFVVDKIITTPIAGLRMFVA